MSKKIILKNVNRLHEKSVPVSDISSAETNQIIQDLIDTLPDQQLGLAAPQIDVFQRIFLASLGTQKLVFVNPTITPTVIHKMDSREGCLSLPDLTRTVARFTEIQINADLILDVSKIEKNTSNDFSACPKLTGPLTFNLLNATIMQHEFDHLEGVLIIDLPEVPSSFEKVQKNQDDRAQRIHRKREDKKSKLKRAEAETRKIRLKNLDKKMLKKDHKYMEQLMITREKNKAHQSHLFDSE